MVVIDSFKGEYVTDQQGWSDILKKLQNFIDSQNSLYVESQAQFDEDILHNIPNSVRVNQNVLDIFHIKDINNHSIKPQSQTLLVPLSRKMILQLKNMVMDMPSNILRIIRRFILILPIINITAG